MTSLSDFVARISLNCGLVTLLFLLGSVHLLTPDISLATFKVYSLLVVSLNESLFWEHSQEAMTCGETWGGGCGPGFRIQRKELPLHKDIVLGGH